MRLRLPILTACGLALAACGDAEVDTGAELDPTTSGTGGGHLGAAPDEQIDQPPPADAAEGRADP
jgi:hypothetical protein